MSKDFKRVRGLKKSVFLTIKIIYCTIILGKITSSKRTLCLKGGLWNMSEGLNNRKRFNFRSIKTRLIVGMIALAIIPLITLGFVSNHYTKEAVYEEVSRSSLEMTKQVNASINNLLLGAEAQVNLMGNNISFTEFYENPLNAKNSQYLLQGIQESRADFQHVYFASTKKDFLISPKVDLPDGYDPTSRDWYKKAVEEKGKIVFNKPYEDAVTKHFVLTISKAVVNKKTNEITGVVAIDIVLETLASKTNEISIGKNGYVAVVDSDGTMITHPNKELIGTDTITKLSLWKDMSAKQEGYSTYNFNGSEKFSAFGTNKLTGWKVVSTLEKKEMNAGAKRIQGISFGMMLLFGVISIAVSIFISRRIANNMEIVKNGFKQAAMGDLTTRIHVKTKDEFKELEHSFNDMMENLSNALKNVESSSKSVLETASSLSAMTYETSESVAQVAKAINQIADGNSHQAENTQAGYNEITTLSEKLDQIASSTNQIEEASNVSAELGNKGLQKVLLLTEKSSQTIDSTTEVRNIVADIEEKMGAINVILQSISEISEQTNMLSLNASIEAARAGEHGRGFAVVANEVRKLAEQSKTSAIEIKQILDTIKLVVSKAVEAMNKTQTVVNEQESAVEETKEIFNEILNSVHTLAEKVKEVKVNVVESEHNKERAVKEIESISSVSQQVAASSEEVSASAEEIAATMGEFTNYAQGLQQLSQQLDEEINKFKLR